MYLLRSEVGCTGPPAIYSVENRFRAGYSNEYGTIIGYSDAWELDPRRVFQGREPMINSHRYRRADVEPRPTGVNRALVPNNVSVPEEIARYLHIARWRF